MILVSWLLSRKFHQDLGAAYAQNSATKPPPCTQFHHHQQNNNREMSGLTMMDTINQSIAIYQPDNSLSLGVILEGDESVEEEEEDKGEDNNSSIEEKQKECTVSISE